MTDTELVALLNGSWLPTANWDSLPSAVRRAIRRYLLKLQRRICGICGAPIALTRDANVDHIRPKSRGGKNNIENLRATHIHCNHKRGNKR